MIRNRERKESGRKRAGERELLTQPGERPARAGEGISFARPWVLRVALTGEGSLFSMEPIHRNTI
jgi:hypothetical protein